MKKNYKTKKTTRLLILLTIMSLILFGCGSTQAESTTEPEKQEPEVVEEVETTVEETPTVQEEPETTEETTEAEKKYEAPVSSMVDWETFATQADNNEICLVISNEQTSTQTVLFKEGTENSTCFYNYEEGDKVAVPIKDNITRVCYYIAEVDGTQKTDIQNVYWKDDGEKLPYVEIKIENEPQYYISIFDNENNKYTFGLYK